MVLSITRLLGGTSAPSMICPCILYNNLDTTLHCGMYHLQQQFCHFYRHFYPPKVPLSSPTRAKTILRNSVRVSPSFLFLHVTSTEGLCYRRTFFLSQFPYMPGIFPGSIFSLPSFPDFFFPIYIYVYMWNLTFLILWLLKNFTNYDNASLS